jgi:hypothetical protein
MMRVLVVSALCAAMVLAGSSASAQEHGQVGLSMGFPATVGLIWHATDRIGVRAETSFVFSSSEIDSALPLERETDSSGFGIGVAGLFYLSRQDSVSTYLSPRFMYTRTTAEIEGPDLPIVVPQQFPLRRRDVELEGSEYSFAGSFGAQYSPNRRLSVFGEVGLDYSQQDSSTSRRGALEVEGSSFGTRGAVGIVWYFN